MHSYFLHGIFKDTIRTVYRQAEEFRWCSGMLPAHLVLLPDIDKPCQGVLRSACRRDQLSSAAHCHCYVMLRAGNFA